MMAHVMAVRSSTVGATMMILLVKWILTGDEVMLRSFVRMVMTT